MAELSLSRLKRITHMATAISGPWSNTLGPHKSYNTDSDADAQHCQVLSLTTHGNADAQHQHA